MVSIGAKQHVSLFVMYGGVLRALRDELAEYNTSNTVIRFTLHRPLPDRLVTKLVKARTVQIEHAAKRR